MKSKLGGKGNSLYCGRPGQKLKQDRSLEAGTEAEAVEGTADWLAPHGWPVPSKATCQGGLTRGGLAPPISTTNYENAGLAGHW